jgi:Protein of unknown function (DUF3617)
MMLRASVLAGVLGALAFCAVSATSFAQPNTASAPSTRLAAAGGIQTGAYHTVWTITSLTGLPPATAQAMMSQPAVVDDCNATTDINALVQQALAENGDMTCTQNHGTAAGGAIHGAATCRNDDDGTSGALTFAGSYSDTHVAIDGDLSVTGTPFGPVQEHVRMVSDRTGACTSAGSH